MFVIEKPGPQLWAFCLTWEPFLRGDKDWNELRLSREGIVSEPVNECDYLLYSHEFPA